MKPFPRIKVCGITRVQDALLAARLGADYLGLITYRKSPRCVSQRSARAIIEAIAPTVQFVLVYVNETSEKIIANARRLRCAVVQIHGSYTAREVVTMQKAGLRVIRAFQIGGSEDVKRARASRADFVLLDNKDRDATSVYGGTGKQFNWELLKRKATRPQNMIIAGGLSSANFETAIDELAPLVLDFNSSLESSPGIKSAAKLRRLFKVLQDRRRCHAS